MQSAECGAEFRDSVLGPITIPLRRKDGNGELAGCPILLSLSHSHDDPCKARPKKSCQGTCRMALFETPRWEKSESSTISLSSVKAVKRTKDVKEESVVASRIFKHCQR